MINFICNIVIMLSVITIFIAIAFDFVFYNDKEVVKKSKKSIVATGTMIGFFVIYYLILRSNIGTLSIKNDVLIIVGTILIFSGSAINVLARFNLGANWANHIKIYDNHRLIKKGFYKIVRHPLYSSIMLMLFGGTIVYSNWMAFCLTVAVFIPFMYYRAKQEENLLKEEFKDYEDYQKKVGMFFPKIWR